MERIKWKCLDNRIRDRSLSGDSPNSSSSEYATEVAETTAAPCIPSSQTPDLENMESEDETEPCSSGDKTEVQPLDSDTGAQISVSTTRVVLCSNEELDISEAEIPTLRG